jgi:hypothetical protein
MIVNSDSFVFSYAVLTGLIDNPKSFSPNYSKESKTTLPRGVVTGRCFRV